ncbi:hypothetical protein [Clostridium saccharobutylicum]|uniref:Uncharacterized protein n=1 Tax=Clostridium saccharobutylicum TaxID=169679 RepID=A0A1S8MRE5_CLOSA|nr:hypothetical protein [Clostridium saccharobutylicum]OOM06763.1 hypothetical protein CLOSAC_41910 [Clostridium saccharobutylicum]
MMNKEFKRYIYIAGTICVIFLAGALFLHLLPFLLMLGVIAYVGIRINRFIKKKKAEKSNSQSQYNHNYKDENNYETSAEEYTTGEVIDVEYEDVDNK